MQFLFRNIKVARWRIPVVVLIWFGFALVASVLQVLRHGWNDYLIFKGVFWHLWEQKNLFADYPAEYFDSNHYGPIFGLLIAPFALLPTGIGAILWALLQAWILQFAIRKLPLNEKQQLTIIAIAAIEMMTATHNLEFNSMLTAWLLLAYVLVEKEKDFWATLFIAAGFLVKLYGIGGLLFFAFSRHRLKFAASFVFWMAVLFCLPMILSSPRFIAQSYYDWYESLVVKNTKNIDLALSGGWQDISVMGLLRRVFRLSFENGWVLAPAAALVTLPLLRFRQYASDAFRLSYLAIVLITVVIFSTAAESPTYVIAMTGVGVWFILNRGIHPRASLLLLILALVLTSLSSTDLFPKAVKSGIVRAYSLKALPPFIIWLWLIADVTFRKFIAYKSKFQLYEAC